jgi:hypothetical protein
MTGDLTVAALRSFLQEPNEFGRALALAERLIDQHLDVGQQLSFEMFFGKRPINALIALSVMNWSRSIRTLSISRVFSAVVLSVILVHRRREREVVNRTDPFGERIDPSAFHC